ncbi:hypothetical protein X798_01971 [Onchocerca flexuosa]|uniref:Uncharacterized protein n=1 Tax=Onchocerca flexuosa TaxID=387005 RepID=A0A238C209_9BILA|nr:hypothetical protein X798_01971 [Onchocerca flexuosa]
MNSESEKRKSEAHSDKTIPRRMNISCTGFQQKKITSSQRKQTKLVTKITDEEGGEHEQHLHIRCKFMKLP